MVASVNPVTTINCNQYSLILLSIIIHLTSGGNRDTFRDKIIKKKKTLNVEVNERERYKIKVDRNERINKKINHKR